MSEIANRDLKLGDVPETTDAWHAFAQRFDGYGIEGGFDTCAEIANRRSPETLTEFRICLFFEARRWRHFGVEPEGEDLRYIESLLSGIRKRVASRDLA